MPHFIALFAEADVAPTDKSKVHAVCVLFSTLVPFPLSNFINGSSCDPTKFLYSTMRMHS